MSHASLTILLIPGCFSTPVCFDNLVPYLEQAGYATLRASFPSSNSTNPSEVTAQKDIDYVRQNNLLPVIERDCKDVILAVHSYGGVVAGGAAVGLSKTDRMAKGLDGGVIAMIYIAGNIVQEGQTLLESCGGAWPDWFKKDQPQEGLAIMEPLLENMYHDHFDALTERIDSLKDGEAKKDLESEVVSLRKSLQKAMVPQGYYCLTTKVPSQAWAEKGYSGRLKYIQTVQDRVNPEFAQKLWMEGSKVQWDVDIVNNSHAPYMSQPKELAQIIADFVRKSSAL